MRRLGRATKQSRGTFGIGGLLGGLTLSVWGGPKRRIHGILIAIATRFLLTQLATPLGAAIAGPLADHVFEPAMQPGGDLTQMFGGVFGVGLGAGMALQLTLFASCGVLVGLGGYKLRRLLRVEISEVG